MSAAGYRRVASDVRRFGDAAPGEAIEVVDRAITDRLRADTGDGRFSHGRDLGAATTRVTSGRGEAEVTAAGSMRVWAILEGGTSGHTQDAGPGRAFRTPAGPRRRVTVSGVAARHSFTESCEEGLTRAGRELEQTWQGLGG